jgi:hypothetical protein
MIIPTLPLTFIGWFFAVGSFAALAVGVILLKELFRSGKISQDYMQTRIASDFALLVLWFIGLVSAFGLLNGYSWGRTGLEYFCWVLIALTLLSSAERLYSYRKQPPGLTARGWLVAISGVMLVALPLIVLCGVSISTLRSEQVMQQFEPRS